VCVGGGGIWAGQGAPWAGWGGLHRGDWDGPFSCPFLSTRPPQRDLVPALLRAHVNAELVVGLDVDKDAYDKYGMRANIGTTGSWGEAGGETCAGRILEVGHVPLPPTPPSPFPLPPSKPRPPLPAAPLLPQPPPDRILAELIKDAVLKRCLTDLARAASARPPQDAASPSAASASTSASNGSSGAAGGPDAELFVDYAKGIVNTVVHYFKVGWFD
jgi:hypothetical protein